MSRPQPKPKQAPAVRMCTCGHQDWWHTRRDYRGGKPRLVRNEDGTPVLGACNQAGCECTCFTLSPSKSFYEAPAYRPDYRLMPPTKIIYVMKGSNKSKALVGSGYPARPAGRQFGMPSLWRKK